MPASNDALAETSMPPVLPPEIFDLIVDHLHNEPPALRSCCLVSKSWVPRARRNLFVQVTLRSSWMNVFPDPFNSPGHYTRILRLLNPATIIDASAFGPTWVHHFRHIEELQVANLPSLRLILVPFVQLHGLSPTLKSLYIFNVSAHLSEVFNLICSFPLLEDLRMHFVTIRGDVEGWHIPSTSPRLTGVLSLSNPIHSATRGLLDLPNGIHFAGITAYSAVEDVKAVADLISRCSDTLEHLGFAYDSSSVFYFAPVVDRYLTSTYRFCFLFKYVTLRS